MNSGERSANSGRKINDRQIMKIETERLLLYPISDKEMVQLVDNEQDADLKQAYSEMLQGCVSEPEKRIWHAVWFMELKSHPGTIVGDLSFKGLAADGIVSGSSELGVLLRGSTTCRELIGLRTPADYNTRLKKGTADYRSAHAEFLRDGIFADSGVIQGDNRVDINILDFGIARDSNVDIVVDKNSLNSFSPCVDDIRYIADTSAGLIEFDDVIDVNVGLFSGHVYDTSCMSTLYIANGIITSNCHCSTAPYEDDDEYDAWMAFLDAGGTTVEWDRYGKKRWRESRKK